MAANNWLVEEARYCTNRLVVSTGQGDDKETRRSLEVAAFDGFYLTRIHYSNNSSATLHDSELEISYKKWSDTMSEHLQFCYAISQIWSDIIK